MVEPFSYLIAIDGGGTHCRFAMATPAGRIEVKLGSANVFSDREAALRTLNEGLDALIGKSALPRDALSEMPIYAGLAGVTDDATASEVARQLPSRIIQVEDDRRSAVVGALGDRSGCLAGIGTGSFLARQADGVIRFAGGYGPLIGDEASGNWLGTQLLRYLLLAADGIAPPSPLTRDVSSGFNDDPMRIVAYSRASRPADIAGFAPRIITAAKEGDEVALKLMKDGANYIVGGVRALGWSGSEPICAVGGVARHYASYLPEDMRATLTEPEGTAIDGALQLAQRLAERSRTGAV